MGDLSDGSIKEKGNWGGAGETKIKKLVRAPTKKYTGGKNKKLAGIGELKGSMFKQKTTVGMSMNMSEDKGAAGMNDSEVNQTQVGMSEFSSVEKNKVEI